MKAYLLHCFCKTFVMLVLLHIVRAVGGGGGGGGGETVCLIIFYSAHW